MKTLNLLVISDLHANNDRLDKLDEQFKKADGVIFAGDFAECFKPETGKAALDRLCKKHENIFAVLGNCDNEQFMEDLENQDICIEKSLVYFEGLALCGAGGGSKFTGKTEFERTEEEIISDFDIIDSAIKDTGDASLWDSLVLVCHNPPKATVVDAVNAEVHAGSPLFTEYIKEHQPVCVICGHIHEGVGTEKIGNTLVINPGSFGEKGTYCALTLNQDDEGKWSVKSAEIKESE